MTKTRKKLTRPKPRSLNKFQSPITLHKLDWFEWFSIGACICLFIYPKPYKELFTIVLALPIIGILLNGISRPSLASLVSISDNHKYGYDLADFIEFPGLVILIRVLMDFEFESFYSILKVGTVAFVLLLLLLRATHRQVEDTNKNKGLIYFAVIGNIALYSYAATYGLNCIYDNSAPKVYETKVIDKSISRSRRSTSYYLKVQPWGHHREAEKIKVDQWKYDKIRSGDNVLIDYKEGLLGIPWYYVE